MDQQKKKAPEAEAAPVAAAEERLPVPVGQTGLEIPAKPAPAEPERKGEDGKKDYKKKAVKAGVAVVTSASVLVGGLFSSPDALLAKEQNLNPVVVSQNDGDGDQNGDEEDSGDREETERESEKAGLREALRQRILGLPLAVRVFVMVPLWALGTVIWNVAVSVWTLLLEPVAGKVVSWLFLLAALLGAAALGLKTVFPNMPLKKIFNKKSLLGLILAGLGLGIADLTVPLFWDGYEELAQVLRASGMALILGTVAFALIRGILRKQKAAPAPVPAEGPTEPEQHAWTDAEILALADSVGKKR